MPNIPGCPTIPDWNWGGNVTTTIGDEDGKVVTNDDGTIFEVVGSRKIAAYAVIKHILDRVSAINSINEVKVKEYHISIFIFDVKGELVARHAWKKQEEYTPLEAEMIEEVNRILKLKAFL